jgi:hypothetical protein
MTHHVPVEHISVESAADKLCAELAATRRFTSATQARNPNNDTARPRVGHDLGHRVHRVSLFDLP